MWILLDKQSLFASDFNDRHKNRKESERNIYGVTDSVTLISVKIESTTGMINERMHVQNA